MTEKYLSTKKTLQWMQKHVVLGDKDIIINKKFLRKLDDTCRLMPEKHSLFGKKYALSSLKEYAHDVKPR